MKNHLLIFLLTFWLQGNIFSTIALVLPECDNILSGSAPTGYTSTTRFATNCHSSWKEKKFCLLDLEKNRGYDCADKESMNQKTEVLTVSSAQMANEGVSTFQNKIDEKLTPVYILIYTITRSWFTASGLESIVSFGVILLGLVIVIGSIIVFVASTLKRTLLIIFGVVFAIDLYFLSSQIVTSEPFKYVIEDEANPYHYYSTHHGAAYLSIHFLVFMVLLSSFLFYVAREGFRKYNSSRFDL